MNNSTQHIRLNGLVYNQKNVENLHIESEPENSWRNAIYFFLKKWFDNSDSILILTSGSTGEPKNIPMAKSTMRNSARMTNAYFNLDANKTAFLCLPAIYIAGKMMLVRALVGGFNLITVEPSANPFETINYPIDFTAITPYQLANSITSLQTSSVSNIIVGGSPVQATLQKAAETIPATLFETYGMTETSSHIALRQINGANKSDCFTALNGISLRLDERKCLVINAPFLVDQEIVTNDVVELINEKTFRWLGRADSVINSGGVKIHPEQVEKKLEGIISTPYFIASLPDQLLDNKVVLVIETETFTLQQKESLMAEIEKNLHKYEIPKQILFCSNFIYSQNNKLLRAETLKKIILKLD